MLSGSWQRYRSGGRAPPFSPTRCAGSRGSFLHITGDYRGTGLAREYVYTCAREALPIERIRQVLFYNKRSARGIDQKTSRLHSRESCSIDDSPRLRQKRAVQAHHICGSQQLVQFAPFKAGPRRSIFPCFVAGNHAHPHGGRNLSDPPADTPEPHNSHGFAFHFDERSLPEAEICAPRPFTCASCFAVQCDVMTKFEQECEHQLRYRGSAVGGDIGDRDATRPGGLEVDLIVTGEHHADVA